MQDRVARPHQTSVKSRILLLGVLSFAAGCTSNAGAPEEDAGSGAPTEGGAPTPETLRAAYRTAANNFSLAPVDWRPCPISTGGTGTDAQCADITVPLSWLAPHSKTTSVFVKRVPSSVAPASRQVWILVGGPGLGGITFDNAVAGFRAPLPPDTELFILDYRGTGRSSRLTCPSEEDWAGSLAPPLVKQCFAEIETKMPPADLYEYNTTETAMDVGMLAGALHTAGSQIIVQSGSFGTFVAHRYLHLFPEQPDAVVLDSVVLPDGTTNFDRNRDAAVRTLLGLCAMNSDCKAHLGADPVAFAEGVVARLGQGHCPSLASAGVDLAVFQFLAGRAVELEPWLLPALYYRADRCDPADVTALVKYWGPPPPPSPPAPQDPSSVLKSDPLALLVQRSELTNETTFDDGTALTLAGTGTSDFYHSIWDALPAYPRDAFWGEWAHTDAPILVLQGELDIRTPRGSGEAARDHLANGRLQFVSFPWKGHAPSTVEGSCGQSLDAKFIANPTAALDTSCTLQAKPPSFSGDSTAQFGQADVWDNATP